MKHKHGSLFTGAAGFDLAAEWAGWETSFQCEIDKFCTNNLRRKWPNTTIYADIKTTDFKPWRGKLLCLSGGDPCQPSSVAGLGKGTADDRYLWPEMFRAIRESQPAFVVNENVSGTFTNCILDIKINDLESEGYFWQAYSIPAEAVGALHQRERIWLVAFNPNHYDKYRNTREIHGSSKEEWVSKRDSLQHFSEPVNLWDFITDSDSQRLQELHVSTVSGNGQEGLSRYFGFGPTTHGNIPKNIIESSIMGMLNGLPEGMDYADRSKRIKQMGNAVVPQIPYEIFQGINELIESLNP